MTTIPPVLVLNTGRCGSTLLSNMLNLHPRVLSLSEFFSAFGTTEGFARPRPTGEQVWRFLSRANAMTKRTVEVDQAGELLYPLGDPTARFTLETLPPILAFTLPHLTGEYEAMYDALGPVVRHQPRQPIGDHFRQMFGWLAERFGADLWVERSGGSLAQAPVMLRHFPEARVIHLFRDGRDTALSMQRHPSFRSAVAVMKHYESRGVDMFAWLRRVERSDRLAFWMYRIGVLLLPARLPYEKLTAADFGRFWSWQIEIANRVLGRLSPDRLLNIRFEDMQRDPEGEVRRMIAFIHPSLEDTAWVREAVALCRPRGPSAFAALAVSERDALEEACRPGLESLGYPP